MANLLLTNGCNRRCPYCFAADNNVKGKFQTLSFDDLRYVAEFMVKSGQRHLNLLGGEPTVHPQFQDFLAYLMHREFHVTVFTNGMLAKKKTDALAESLRLAARGSVTFVVNINEKEYRLPNETMLEQHFFERLGKWARLGFNIFETSWKPKFLVDTILQYGLQKSIRLGLASPISSMTETAFAKIGEYRRLYELILELVDEGYPHGISVGFDCAFPLCGFTEAEVGRLFVKGTRLQFTCSVPLDIGTDLKTWNCFPLNSQHLRTLQDFSNLQEAQEFYTKAFGENRRQGLYQECDDCPHMKSGACGGGCMGHYLDKPRHEKPHFPFYGTDISPEITAASMGWMNRSLEGTQPGPHAVPRG